MIWVHLALCLVADLCLRDWSHAWTCWLGSLMAYVKFWQHHFKPEGRRGMLHGSKDDECAQSTSATRWVFCNRVMCAYL